LGYGELLTRRTRISTPRGSFDTICVWWIVKPRVISAILLRLRADTLMSINDHESHALRAQAFWLPPVRIQTRLDVPTAGKSRTRALPHPSARLLSLPAYPSFQTSVSGDAPDTDSVTFVPRFTFAILTFCLVGWREGHLFSCIYIMYCQVRWSFLLPPLLTSGAPDTLQKGRLELRLWLRIPRIVGHVCCREFSRRWHGAFLVHSSRFRL
jgi:hypothetical protein